MASDVIGREEELGAIQAFLAEVEQGPSSLVLSGEPGIGKTILWERGVEEAAQSYGRVLTCRGVEAEASLSFAGLSELISPVLAATAPSLVAPRRRALEVALLLVEPGTDAPDTHAIGLAVLDVLRVLAERGAVLVALDDVQWLDASSAGVLQIALRRLRDAPVGVLATLRTAADVAAARVRARVSGGAAAAARARPAQPGRAPSSAPSTACQLSSASDRRRRESRQATCASTQRQASSRFSNEHERRLVPRVAAQRCLEAGRHEPLLPAQATPVFVRQPSAYDVRAISE